MRVLTLSNFPIEAAATRFRLEQFVAPLRKHNIELHVKPFLTSEQFARLYQPGGSTGKVVGILRSLGRRVAETFSAGGGYDLLLVQREAMFFGPAFFEWIFQNVRGLPMVLDLDDATYVPYVSPSYGRLGSFLKFFGKTNSLIRQADHVICGNRFIAEHVRSLGSKATVVPTVVDTDVYRPADPLNDVPVLGWIGTHSTFSFLRSIFPVLEKLAAKHRFRLRIVGAGKVGIGPSDLEIENLEWDMAREPTDFSTIDIGLYPIAVSDSANEAWLRGKSGFKAIQYFAVGVPFVMSPVGVCAELGVEGETHFNAETPEDWYNSLDKVLSDAALRRSMGDRGRQYALANFTVPAQAAIVADVLRSVTLKP